MSQSKKFFLHPTDQSRLAGMQLVQFPFAGIVFDIFAEMAQIRFIPNDVFPIIALPDMDTRRVISHPLGNADFETAHN